MVRRRRGDVVLVSSDVTTRPRPFMAAYSASKWGLEGMAGAMQMELEGTGVRVSVVRPGPTWSEAGTDWDPDEAAFVPTSGSASDWPAIRTSSRRGPWPRPS